MIKPIWLTPQLRTYVVCTIVASRQKYQKEPHDVCTSFNSDDEHYWFSAISKLPMAYETNFECWMDLKN